MFDNKNHSIPKRIFTAFWRSVLVRYAIITFRSCSLNSSGDNLTSSISLGDTFNALQMSERISTSGRFIPCSQLETLLLLTPIKSANSFWLKPRISLYLQILAPISYFIQTHHNKLYTIFSGMSTNDFEKFCRKVLTLQYFCGIIVVYSEILERSISYGNLPKN